MPATSRVRARSLRLGAKLQLLLAAGSLAILAGVLAVQTLQRVSDTYTDRRDANLRIARVMAGPLSSALPIADPAAVYGYMEILEKDPAAAAVVIVKDGEATKSQQSLEHLDMPLEALQAVALDAAASNSDRVADEGDFEFVGVPVVDSAGRVMGALGIGWSTEGLYARIWRDALVQAGAVAAACLVLLWLLERAVRRLVTGPLGAIADAVERDMAGGEGRERTGPVLDHEARADEIGTLARALGQFRRRAGEVRTLNAHFDAALGNMTQGLCLFDARGRLLVHNRCFEAMFGTPPPGAAAAALGSGREMEGMFDPPDPAGRDGEDRRAHELADGRVVQVSRRAIADGGWVATFEDVTERRRSQERLSHMARHDALTGLPNRVLLREHMEHVLARVRRGGGAAVLCLDLDGFKGVNDTLGHPAGDELLRQVARRLKGCTRETDLVARLGGDEFAIVQEDAERPADATVLAGRLVEALRAPFELHGQRVEIGTSIGVVSADAAATPDELLRGADIALYQAKADGRGTWRSFEPGMDAEMQARRALEADLRRALAEGQFELYYQPLVEADAGALAGFEALLRWRHPERGMVSPGEFIPLAEATGLIRPLGAWVLARACADAARWPEHVKVAVNLSPAQFAKGDLMGEVERALAASGLPAYRLELEITESVLLRDNAATLSLLHRLRALGVSIAMDDFGTGYSSLSYLRSFPFDKIKVDQSFVRDLGRGKGGAEIVRAVVGLGQALGMCVLAEGVETAEQLAVLRDEGCDEVQGYLFSRPRPVRDVPGIIAGYPAAKADPAPGPVLVPVPVPVLVIDNAGNGDTGDGQAAA